MARPASLICPRCEGMLSRVAETREDPDYRLGAVIWRIHACLDCGLRYASAQQLVSLVEADDRMAELARERTMMARAGRRFAHPTRADALR